MPKKKNLRELNKRVFSSKKRLDNEKNMVRLHHVLMNEYGWIPLEEFKNLPINTFLGLIKEIEKDRKRENKKMKSR
ncbi:MAG: hypothetical protein ACOC5T_09220 [Elusimicrobiota bacterium]